jgi:hypothetical protein
MLARSRREERRPRTTRRWPLPAAAAVACAGAACAPGLTGVASAASGTTIVVSGDSVVATSLPSAGQTTISVTRPDAITGTPVVIGLESGNGTPFTPFSANTITPTPLAPTGDCWQKGALSEALTPDIQPGDTVTVSQAGFFGSAGTSTSTVAQPADLSNAILGPISGCSSIAPWAQNAITRAPSSIAGRSALTVSGVAQPLATGVSVSVSDGKSTTEPASTTPGGDGSWSVTVPASALSSLGSGRLTVTPVMAVPDVSTGAPAHIAGVGVTVDKAKTAAPSSSSVGSSSPQTVSVKAGGSKRQAKVKGARVPTRVSMTSARKHGVKVSFIVPSGVHYAQVGLHEGRRRLYAATVRTRRANTRQTVTLPARLARHLRAGRYTVAIEVGTSRTKLGGAVTRTIRVTRS